MSHGLHDQKLKKSLRFQDFFFILGLVAQHLKVQTGHKSPPVHCSVGSRGNLVSGLGFPVGRKEHISWKIHLIRSLCSVSGLGILELGSPFNQLVTVCFPSSPKWPRRAALPSKLGLRSPVVGSHQAQAAHFKELTLATSLNELNLLD